MPRTTLVSTPPRKFTAAPVKVAIPATLVVGLGTKTDGLAVSLRAAGGAGGAGGAEVAETIGGGELGGGTTTAVAVVVVPGPVTVGARLVSTGGAEVGHTPLDG